MSWSLYTFNDLETIMLSASRINAFQSSAWLRFVGFLYGNVIFYNCKFRVINGHPGREVLDKSLQNIPAYKVQGKGSSSFQMHSQVAILLLKFDQSRECHQSHTSLVHIVSPTDD